MERDLTNWQGCARPERLVLEGRYARLEPLDARRHGDGLFACSTMPDCQDRFRWLPEHPPESREAMQPWLEQAQASEDPLYFVVIDQASGRVAGRQTLMRINEVHGVIETGHIFWSSIIARRPAATESFFLFARYVFDDLGYRRFEWKCNDLNEASKRAARRFGMQAEGVHRQAAVMKGVNRDTAWFSMLDREWSTNREAFEAWLDADNFKSDGTQMRSLEAIRNALAE